MLGGRAICIFEMVVDQDKQLLSLNPNFHQESIDIFSDFNLQDRAFPRSANDFIAATISQLHTHFAADDICEIQLRLLYSLI